MYGSRLGKYYYYRVLLHVQTPNYHFLTESKIKAKADLSNELGVGAVPGVIKETSAYSVPN